MVVHYENSKAGVAGKRAHGGCPWQTRHHTPLDPLAFCGHQPTELILALSNEMLLCIGGHLSTGSLSQFLLCNRRLHTLFKGELRKRALLNHAGVPSHVRAAMGGYMPLLRFLAEHPTYNFEVNGFYAVKSSGRFWIHTGHEKDLYTPLFLAVQSGHVDIVEELILMGADPTVRCGAFVWTIEWPQAGLEVALEPKVERWNRDELITRQLAGYFEMSCMTAAVLGGHLDVVQVLLTDAWEQVMEWGSLKELEEVCGGRMVQWANVEKCKDRLKEHEQELSYEYFRDGIERTEKELERYEKKEHMEKSWEANVDAAMEWFGRVAEEKPQSLTWASKVWEVLRENIPVSFPTLGQFSPGGL